MHASWYASHLFGPMYHLLRRSAPAKPSRAGKWGRRFLFGAGVMAASYVCADHWTANSFTRSLRTIKTTVQISYLYKTTTPKTSEEYSSLHRTAAQMILDVCLKNEGLYIKIGQGFNALNHILPREYTDVLKVLLDQAPSVPFDEISRIIKEETGKKVEELFSYFDPVPVASASIAQVHRAKLRPATPQDEPMEVAVKVQKPKIRYQVFWDLETYRFVTWMIGVLFNMPVGWAKKSIIDGIRRETDFSAEANNVEQMRCHLAGNPNVYVPKLHKELVTPRLLVLEWIDAVKLIDVETVRQQFDAVTVLRTVFDVFGDMLFKYSFVHCDPHAANVLVRRPPLSEQRDGSQRQVKKCKNPQVVLLDFGLCCPETERFRVEYALIFKSIVLRDTETIMKIITTWGITDADVFASIQMQKPYESLRRGNHGEVTKMELFQMQVKARERAQTLLANQELIPPELPLVGRSIDILRGLNRLYGAPINRINMFVRRAVAGLGPINSYESAQYYLEQIDRTVDATATKKKVAAAPSKSVFDVGADRQRREQAAAALIFHSKRNASLGGRLREYALSLYRKVLFEIVLALFDAFHMTVRLYTTLLEAFVPGMADARLNEDSLEELLKRRDLRFGGPPPRERRAE
ncbi:putative ABC transporter [Trypanosoma cruzi]|uniref:ABC transporter, putative n=2 Tax=Trypanosoma cruzi TaxID=5693 RepID=Q4DPX9_TRYCC|nr:ABC transporter, putative [Trypanosoma cruzi]EAN94568.1 ABC transporter, putative [Trypanosoma cruzi]PWV20079.1 putative ABC transporter [Trypanosoma cruzi]|eukprot:XP_816419.1 ABC transporter [Trypanosoma cruzi strain CL Brener]